MQKAIIGILMFIIILMFFSGLFFFYEARYMSGRASVVNNSIDPDNSYVTYNPLSAKASGDQKIRVTAVVLSPQGLGVSGIAVSLSNPGDALKIEVISGTTDTLGRAFFNISTKTAGEYNIEAKAGGVAVTQKARLLFN